MLGHQIHARVPLKGVRSQGFDTCRVWLPQRGQEMALRDRMESMCPSLQVSGMG